MFSGFDRGTFEFFMAISFNNNRDFFYDNHDWYARSVRTPLRELCEELAPTLLEIDRDIEVRPARVISHINRDLRYSRDKSPYRDYMWLGYHRGGWDKRDCFHFYFDISAQGGNVGAGMYGDDRAWTDAIRAAIQKDPARVKSILCSGQLNDFTLGGQSYKRMSVPDGLSQDLRAIYTLKSFGLNHAYTCEELMKGDIAEDIEKHIRALKGVYDFMYSIRPEREEKESAFDRIAGAHSNGLRESF